MLIPSRPLPANLTPATLRGPGPGRPRTLPLRQLRPPAQAHPPRFWEAPFALEPDPTLPPGISLGGAGARRHLVRGSLLSRRSSEEPPEPRASRSSGQAELPCLSVHQVAPFSHPCRTLLRLPRRGIRQDNKGTSEKHPLAPGEEPAACVWAPMAQRRSPVEARELEIGPKLASLTFGLKAGPADIFQ